MAASAEWAPGRGLREDLARLPGHPFGRPQLPVTHPRSRHVLREHPPPPTHRPPPGKPDGGGVPRIDGQEYQVHHRGQGVAGGLVACLLRAERWLIVAQKSKLIHHWEHGKSFQSGSSLLWGVSTLFRFPPKTRKHQSRLQFPQYGMLRIGRRAHLLLLCRLRRSWMILSSHRCR